MTVPSPVLYYMPFKCRLIQVSSFFRRFLPCRPHILMSNALLFILIFKEVVFSFTNQKYQGFHHSLFYHLLNCIGAIKDVNKITGSTICESPPKGMTGDDDHIVPNDPPII